jgi:hypothetical protein
MRETERMENTERLFFRIIDVTKDKKIKRENGWPPIFRPPRFLRL